MGFSRSWNFAAKSASVEPLHNVSYECLNAVCGKLSAICFMWRLGLSAEEQQKPEAAAVLMGMFDAIIQEAGVEQFTICFRSILQAAAGAKLSPLAVPPDDLLRRMIATAWDAKLLPWSFYATHKLAEMQTKRLDVCATIGDVMDAVKSGKFDDPAAHIAAKAVTDVLTVGPRQWAAAMLSSASAAGRDEDELGLYGPRNDGQRRPFAVSPTG